MKHWIQWVALTFAVTLLATVAALVIGRAQPEIATVPGLGRCDGMPCFEGVAPGKTSVTETMQRLLTTYGIGPASVYSKYVNYQLDDATVLFVRYSSFASIDTISIQSVTGGKLTNLGQLVRLLGDPTSVGWGAGGAVIFCFPGLCVENIRSTIIPVTVDWPVTLMIYSPEPVKSVTSPRRWHGFGTYRPY